MQLRKLIALTLRFGFFVWASQSYAGSPVWTFTPSQSYPPTVSVAANGTATIIYMVTNQSLKPHTLVMTP